MARTKQHTNYNNNMTRMSTSGKNETLSDRRFFRLLEIMERSECKLMIVTIKPIKVCVHLMVVHEN